MNGKLNTKPSDQIFPLLGSFWNSHFGQPKLARSMAKVGCDLPRAPEKFICGAHRFLDTSATRTPSGPVSVTVDLRAVRKYSPSSV